MKLEVGMYVRIKNEAGWCCIGEIENINDFREPSMKYCIDIQDIDLVFIPEDMIAKASHNIIDLIEAGDYVNGEKVGYIDNCEGALREYYYDYEDANVDAGHWFEEIKSIVTKEQFESMSYKVQ